MRGAGYAQPAAVSESPSMKRAGIASVKLKETDRVIVAIGEIIKNRQETKLTVSCRLTF